MLLADASPGTLAGAEQMAGSLQRLGLFYVAGVLSAVVAVLAGALAWVSNARLRDNQRMLRESLEVIQQNTITNARFAKALETRLPRLKVPAPEPPKEPPHES